MILFGSTEVFACSCVGMPGQSVEEYVVQKFNASTAVFSGKAVRFEWRKENREPSTFRIDTGDPADWETKVVILKVDRWWRMAAGTELILYTDERRNTKTNMGSGSSCDYSFKLGESYLVYAGGTENRLQTHSCAGTLPESRAKEDIQVLGKGEEPQAAEGSE